MATRTSLTPYYLRYAAAWLTRRSGGVAGLLPPLFSAWLDLHPHQVEAALFAVQSPFREGVILADEEGLGKMIEAGIALLQASLEGRTRLLVLCPPTLIGYWREELAEKFALTAGGLDNVDGDAHVVLMTYAEAQRYSDRLAETMWDLCVLDEAHLLAHAGLSDHQQAEAIRRALQGRPKLLLTATPMQNSVMDLYHLVRFVDETTFPSDPEAFRARYGGSTKHRKELSERAQQICQRTLRRHALTMPSTRRIVRTFLVEPSAEETALSKRLSLFFHREHLHAFPKVQEHRIRLTYWKLMASSPSALAESLDRLANRLDRVPGALDEQTEIRALAAQTRALEPGTRADAFLKAVQDAFRQLGDAGAPQKAMVFSESRATLAFLHDFLSAKGYAGQITAHQSGAVGKKALTAFARGDARILLATDAAGTGLDLSHACLVVNYDLPWNVQKLEQRISRCHRYGQKHDVMVLNFLDPSNRADRRLYDSLNRKLKRFDALFGQSETVLGQVDAAPSISPDEAPRSATTVRANQEADKTVKHEPIARQVERAETDLLAHFDEEVRARFQSYGEVIPKRIEQLDQWLWEITRARLDGRAVFNEAERRFVLDRSPYPGLRLSRITFGMDRALPLPERYRLSHTLARRVLADCLDGPLERGRLVLRARGDFPPGMAGELGLWRAGLSTGVAHETHPVLCGILADGRVLPTGRCEELMKLPAVSCEGGRWQTGAADEGDTYRGRRWREAKEHAPPPLCGEALARARDQALEAVRRKFLAEQDDLLKAELERLQQWTRDEEAAFIEKAAARLRALPKILPPRLVESNAEVDLRQTGVEARETHVRSVALPQDHTPRPNPLAILGEALWLPKATVRDILRRGGRLADFLRNPERFLEEAVTILRECKASMIVDGIRYK